MTFTRCPLGLYFGIAASAMLLLGLAQAVADEKPKSPDKTQKVKQKDNPKRDKQQQAKQKTVKGDKAKGDQPKTKSADPGTSVSLGVIVADSPGPGMLVLSVQPRGPAHDAGIRPGDYILEIDEKKLASPQNLRKAVQAKQPGDKAELKTWRRGEEQMVTALFKSPTRERTSYFRGPADGENLEERPWLGVFMKDSHEPGVWISRVYVNSPASKAGLRSGDRIVRVNENPVSAPTDVADAVNSLQPGDEIQLMIERTGEEQTLTATIGSLADFHQRLFGERFRQKFEGFHDLLDPDFDGIPELERFRLYFRQPEERSEGTSPN